jgi:hypothetical protein
MASIGISCGFSRQQKTVEEDLAPVNAGEAKEDVI